MLSNQPYVVNNARWLFTIFYSADAFCLPLRAFGCLHFVYANSLDMLKLDPNPLGVFSRIFKKIGRV